MVNKFKSFLLNLHHKTQLVNTSSCTHLIRRRLEMRAALSKGLTDKFAGSKLAWPFLFLHYMHVIIAKLIQSRLCSCMFQLQMCTKIIFQYWFKEQFIPQDFNSCIQFFKNKPLYHKMWFWTIVILINLFKCNFHAFSRW